MSEQLTRGDFEDLLNKKVVLKINGETLTAKVKEVNVSRAAWRCRARAVFTDSGYRQVKTIMGRPFTALQHDALGQKWNLFLVPLGPKSGGMSYEAIFT